MKQKEILKSVLKRAKSRKRSDIEMAWIKYLEENLSFPFEAEVTPYSYSSVLKHGDIVKITGIENIVDLYGMLMNVKSGRRKYVVPLAELNPVDTNSPNSEMLEAFLEWEQE